MWVIIDIDEMGSLHTIDTDPARSPMMSHPDGSGPVAVDVLLKYLNTNPTAREAAGWNIQNQTWEETSPATRWQRLVRACNGPDATEQARSLGLEE